MTRSENTSFGYGGSSHRYKLPCRVLGKGTMHALVTWTEYKLTPDDEQWMVRFAVCLTMDFNCFCTASKTV